ncbi:ABC transporter substrate-binding protein [Rhodoferax sp.]|uniref:ABC transporter substrate-binding protein n=1 Tax=Rhodoferax sp. TaxID=50421 RepID=UPI0026241C97|nr:ABC transporter substrate-binding protein [Rhodoferax sp.]MDD2924895.1 ABC transporter substrate-binding protein [Rhodoferax sp.]
MTQSVQYGGRRWQLVAAAWCALNIGLGVVCGGAWAADPAMIRIGVTKIVSHAALDADEKGFEAGLASAGFKEGVNVTYDRQNAQGDLAKARAIALKFKREEVALIHSISTPSTQAVMQSGSTIPLVFSAITDPVGAGIVARDSTPGKKTGSHVTGVSDLWPVLLQMETYAKFVPNAKTWGTIYNPAETNSVMHVRMMQEAARQLGLTLLEAKVANSAEVTQAVRSLVGKVQAITITSDNTAVASMGDIAKVCDTHHLPLFAGDVDSVPRGAVAAYGLDYFLVGYSAGKKAALVLKGVKPGDIPWGPVEKFSLVINRKAAASQGVTLTPGLLKKADKVLN